MGVVPDVPHGTDWRDHPSLRFAPATQAAQKQSLCPMRNRIVVAAEEADEPI